MKLTAPIQVIAKHVGGYGFFASGGTKWYTNTVGWGKLVNLLSSVEVSAAQYIDIFDIHPELLIFKFC